MTMMRTAIYARYSSDLQRPASIEDQVRRCGEEIARRGWQSGRVLSDSEIPGMVSQRRPGYQQLLRGAEAGEFDVIVVDELSRLTRRHSELALLMERLRFWNVGLVSLLEGLDSVSARGAVSAIVAMRSYTNEAEGEANAHRSRRGLAGRVLAGLHAGGAPYGYRTRPVHADRPGDPAGTGMVLRIFRLYAEGTSPRRIAAALNAEHVPSPGARWRDRQGVRCTWSHTAIQGDPKRGFGILNNEKYIGRLVWNRSTWPRDPDRDAKQVRREMPEDKWVVREVPELRIIPQELWDAVKARQRQHSREGLRSAAHWRNRRLLSGLLVCGQCGGSYVLRGANTYACSTRQNRGEVVCDCMVTVDAAAAEKAVLAELQDLFGTEGFLDRLVEQVQQGWRQARAARSRHESSLQELRDQLTQAEGEIQRFLKAIGQGILVDDLAEEMRAAQTRRDRLRTEVAAAEGADLPEALLVLPSTIRKMVSDLPRMLAAGQVGQVKSVLKRLVGQIEVHGEPLPGRKRPGAVLVLPGYMDAVLRLAEQKIKGGNSPGGIRTRDLMAENHAS
jgi:site-specific DNA recombinase